MLFSDVWISPVLSVDGYKYYLLIVDHFTRYMWFFPLKLKSQVASTFTRFKSLVENQFNQRIRTLYTNNGGEYIALASFLATHGISHLTTPPHTLEHNDMSERRHRHIVETGLALLTHASMPPSYWTYAFATETYLINRVPTKTLSMASPYSQLFKMEPHYSKLRVFGCLCYMWLRPYTSHKLDPRSLPFVFLGYSLTESAYLCLHLPTSRLYISRHVEFCENNFPFPLSPSPSAHQDESEPSWVPTVTPLETDCMSLTAPPTPVVLPCSDPLPTNTTSVTMDQCAVPPTTITPTTTTAQNTSSSTTLASSELSTSSPNSEPVNNHQMVTRAKNQIIKTNPKYMYSAHLVLASLDPHTISQALSNPLWRDSVSAEFNSFICTDTFELVPPSTEQNVVGCRWLFQTKFLPDGTVDKHKSRLVAKGYTQRPGIDFHETFSPVVKAPTICIIISVATTWDWPLRQLDINNAFLQGTLDEDVYMQQPLGFVDKDRPNFVCKLKKPIYGLKQAPRSWYNELKRFLLQSEFRNSLADASLFFFKDKSVIKYLLVYVDDIIIMGSSITAVKSLIDLLAKRFALKDLGDLSYFLGIEVMRSTVGVVLSQRKYISDLLHCTRMTGAKPTATPMCYTLSLTLNDGKL